MNIEIETKLAKKKKKKGNRTKPEEYDREQE